MEEEAHTTETLAPLEARYAQIVKELAPLEAEKKKLGGQILADLQRRGVAKEATSYGTFTAANKATWDYSHLTDVAGLMETLSKAQKKAQEEKLAVCKLSPFLRFQAKKDKEETE